MGHCQMDFCGVGVGLGVGAGVGLGVGLGVGSTVGLGVGVAVATGLAELPPEDHFRRYLWSACWRCFHHCLPWKACWKSFRLWEAYHQRCCYQYHCWWALPFLPLWSQKVLPPSSVISMLEEEAGASATFPEPHAERIMARSNPIAPHVVFFMHTTSRISLRNYINHELFRQQHMSCFTWDMVWVSMVTGALNRTVSRYCLAFRTWVVFWLMQSSTYWI